jgi:hypothetical protein
MNEVRYTMDELEARMVGTGCPSIRRTPRNLLTRFQL